MKNFTEIFFSDFTNALGWTLLHSLWQSLVIFGITIAWLRLMPAIKSGTRYLIACAGFCLMIIASIITFFYQHGAPSKVASDQITTVSQNHTYLSSIQEYSAHGLLPMLAGMIEPVIPFVVILWIIGLAYYSVRLFSGLIFTYQLRSCAVPMENEWNQFLKDTAKKLGISRVLSLTESAVISTPMVIGYFKPVVLIPLGMLSGLTREELETIFLHELAHIKRNDYLINILQSVFETIFFFNPFVRLLSNEIRKEREYCCDDLVVRHHAGSHAYAHALVRLAEARLTSGGFALALADDKNQLLNRIKRIMERSVKNQSGRNRIVIPTMILVGGLFCISWLGSDRQDVPRNLQVSADTVPDKNVQGAHYSRRSIITLDEKGQPHEEIIENFEGDERLRPFLEEHIPSIPPVNVFPPREAFRVHPVIPAQPADTIPPAPAPFGFENQHSWEELSRSMEEMQKTFEEFYGQMDRDSTFFPLHPGDARFPDWDNFIYPDQALKSLEEIENSDAFRDLNEQLEQLRDLDFEHFRELERGLAFPGNHMGSYEKVLRDELVKDGYLSEGEAIESLEWNNESFKVNGKTIKKSQQKKYKDLNDKFFAEPRGGGKIE